MTRSPLSLKPEDPVLVDPFSKKGALVLFWLLARRGMGGGEEFSINQAARSLAVGPFTVHRVIRTLEYDGIIRTKGIGTKKRFYLAEPKALLIRWLRHYHIQRKGKLHRYGLSDPQKFSEKREVFLSSLLMPALHTAAQSIFHVGVTNLKSVEGYVSGVASIELLIKKFGLVEQERGYEVLLVEPYYLGVVEQFSRSREDLIWRSAFAVLTFLDLYHFPIRGREQAEALYRKIPALNSLGSWDDFESIEVT